MVERVGSAAPKCSGEREPACEIERLWSLIDQNVVDQPRLRGKLCVAWRRQQGDPGAGVVAPNVRHRAECLNEIAERAELYDQNLLWRPGTQLSEGPQSGHSVQIDMSREVFERPAYRRVQGGVKRADAAHQPTDEAAGLPADPRNAALVQEFASARDAGWEKAHA